jgi:hypothetical protein
MYMYPYIDTYIHIHEYGYNVEFMSQFLTSMHGKYIYINKYIYRYAMGVIYIYIYMYICICIHIYVNTYT